MLSLLKLVFNSGTNFAIITQVTGDAGAGVAPATGKHIVWNYGIEFPGAYSTTTKIRIRAYLNDCFYIMDTRDGQEYSTVQIGTQCWMAENLNYGTMIPGVNEMANNGEIEKYCYDNGTIWCNVYGGLYQWNEMMQYVTTEGVQGICPDGWHLPSYAEYTILSDYLGGANATAGGKMKETGYAHWVPPNTGATNESGFTGLGAGDRYLEGFFAGKAGESFFWTSTQYVQPEPMTHAIGAELHYLHAELYYTPWNKNYGYSVRCTRD
jgi:uncharacterized protein (TIGR02145 family)